MMTLICGKAVDFRGLDSTYGTRATHGSYARSQRSAQAEEPIQVRVRVRHYGDVIPAVRHVRSSEPDLGRLPVGSNLDCYV